MDNKQIVSSIRSLCKSRNITITKLEEDLGLSQGLISRWNKSDPSLSKIIDIANYFNISINDVIGYGNVVNDKFIEKLILKTDNKELQWKPYDAINADALIPKQYFDLYKPSFICQEDADDYCNTHREKSYYTKIKNTYISLYGSYEYFAIINPINIKLFIQPDKDGALIEQSYSKEQLLSLWLKVLFTLHEKAPDEIKAEEFKNSFILDDN